MPGAPTRSSRSSGTSAAQQCTTGSAPAETIARQHPLQGRCRQRRVDRAVPVEAGRRRHPAGEHRRQRRLVDLHEDGGAGHPAAHVRHVLDQPLGQRLGELATGADVGEHPVAARALDGRGQRPRPGDLDLERTGVALGVLLEQVEVLAEQRDRPPVVDAARRPVSRQPAGCRSAAEPGQQRPACGRPCRRRGRGRGPRGGTAATARRAPAGAPRRTQPGRRRGATRRRWQGVIGRPRARPRGRRRSCRSRRRGCRRRRRPTDPGAMPCAGSSSVDRRPGRPRPRRRARCSSPCARSCTVQSSGRRGRRPAPAGADADDAVDRERLARPDGHGAGDRLDVEDVARLAVGRRPCRSAGPGAGRSCKPNEPSWVPSTSPSLVDERRRSTVPSFSLQPARRCRRRR